jgi:broad specificity phosphatase PhoE
VAGNGLNALGHEQAKLLGARLAALPVKPASLVTSNYKRARETADDIGQALGMTPVVDSLLHECNFTSDRPDYMRNDTARRDRGVRFELRARVGEVHGADPAGRPPRRARLPRQRDPHVRQPPRLRRFAALADDGDRQRLAHVLAVRADGRMKLVCFSDVGHLPVAQQSWTGHGAGWGTLAPR